MKKILTIVTIAALFAGCATAYNKVYSDFDRSINFSGYKTFAWLPDKADTVNSPYNNEIIRNNIRNYLGQCLSDRAYSFNAEQPDLLMQLEIKNAKKERVLTATTTYPQLYYYRPYYFGSLYYNPYHYNYYYRYNSAVPYSYSTGSSSTQKIEYINGAITLNVIDRNTNKLIWTGTAEGDIYDPSVIQKDLHPAVHSIIATYPVKPVADSHKRK